MTETELMKKFNIAARYTAHTPETVKRPWVGDLVGKALETSKHVFIGEPHVNGNTVKTYEMLAQNPGIFTEAVKAGVKHFVLEIPDMFQKYVREYAAGEMDRESFRFAIFKNPKGMFMSPWMAGEAMTHFQDDFIQAIDNAHAAGMKVHMADYTWDAMLMVDPPGGFEEFSRQLLKAHREQKSKLNRNDFIVEYMKTQTPEEQARISAMLNKYEADKRHARLDDREQLDMLRLYVPEGESMLGVVGLGHLDDSAGNQFGINYLLEKEGEKVTTIEVYDSANTQKFTEELQALHGGANRKKPDFTIILDEDKVTGRDEKPAPAGRPPKPPASLAA